MAAERGDVLLVPINIGIVVETATKQDSNSQTYRQMGLLPVFGITLLLTSPIAVNDASVNAKAVSIWECTSAEKRSNGFLPRATASATPTRLIKMKGPILSESDVK